MARRPISGLLPQFAKNAGGASASGYWLKLYEPNTTTHIPMYTLQSGGSTLVKCALNSRGETISNVLDDDSTFIPYVDEDFDAYLFFTAADADANNTTNAIFLGQSIVSELVGAPEMPGYVEAQFATVATMIAGTALNLPDPVIWATYVGRTVKTVVNNSTSNAGGAEYLITTTNPGSLSTLVGGIWVGANHSLGGGLYASIRSQNIDAEMFGLVKNNTTVNSSPALNAFFTYTKQQNYSFPPGGSTGYVFMRGTLTSKIPSGIYAVAETVTPTNEDGSIDFNDSVIVPHSTYNTANWALDIIAWTTEIRGLRFSQFSSTSKVCRIRNNNADSGIVDLNRCIFGGAGLYEIDCRSSIVRFNNGRIDRVTRIDVKTCDKFRVVDSWINPPAFSANEQVMFQLMNETPILEFSGGIIVPRVQTASKCALVGIGTSAAINTGSGIVRFQNVLSGNEPNATSYVNCYAAAGTATGRGVRVSFQGGTYGCSSGGDNPLVRLFALPSSVSFSDVDGYEEDSHEESLVFFDSTHQTFAAAEAYLSANSRPLTKIHINGSIHQNFSGLPRNSPLLKCIVSRQPVKFGFVDCIGGAATSIPFPDSTDVNRYISYNIILINKNNGGSTLISEYYISGTFTGALSVTPVLLGASVAAPRLTVSGSGLLVSANGSTFDQEYAYQITQVGDWQNRFY
jgi:hypothetical protein